MISVSDVGLATGLNRHPACDQLQLAGTSARDVAQQAWAAAGHVDIGDIAYGRAHWGNFKQRKETPAPYYGFLAGLVASQGVSRICEIGTHCGGATKAMHRGVPRDTEPRIVTVDVTRESDRQLAGLPGVRKIVGDAASTRTAVRVLNCFSDTHKVDLLFIDANHKYLSEIVAFSVYTQSLSPRLVVMDDININDQMRLMWEKITAARPGSLWLDIATVFPEVRETAVGFGLIVFPENERVPAQRHTLPVVPGWKRNLRAVVRSIRGLTR